MQPTTQSSQHFYRPFWLVFSTVFILLILMIVLLLKISWDGLNQIEKLKQDIMLMRDIANITSELEILNAEQESLSPATYQARLKQISQLLEPINPTEKPLNSSSQIHIEHLKNTLANDPESIVLPKEIGYLQQIQKLERTSQDKRLHLLAQENQVGFDTMLIFCAGLLLLVILIVVFVMLRVRPPLQHLALLLSRLGTEQISTVPIDKLEPFLKPLFVKFNQMVIRLEELEQQQLCYQASLEEKVRQATHTLLDYHHTLAQSERLAIAGELGASLAHELRNPLTGVLLAVQNLHEDDPDTDRRERLQLIYGALQHMMTQLNQLLDDVRHEPEPASSFYLFELVENLLGLLRYQIDERIQWQVNIDQTLKCALPIGRLRQSLANLILNAAQALPDQTGIICINAEQQADQLIIEVIDTGTGFSPQLLSTSIQSFVSKKEGGTGLGLAMVQRFCYEQGGQLQRHNRDEGGATVKMILPKEVTRE